MKITKNFSNDYFRGVLETDDDGEIFTFSKGEPYANVIIDGVMPSVYRAKIGSSMCERYPWGNYAIGKAMPIKKFKVKNTSALLLQCIIILLKSNGASIKSWKSNMALMLPKLTDFATPYRISSALSAAARSMKSTGIMSIDDNENIIISNGDSKVIKRNIANTYKIFTKCREWLSKGESGVKIGIPKEYDKIDSVNKPKSKIPFDKILEYNAKEEVVNKVVEEDAGKPIEKAEGDVSKIMSNSIGANDLVGRSFGALNGAMIEIDTNKAITFEDGMITVTAINSNTYKIDRIYYKPEDAMKAAFGL